MNFDQIIETIQFQNNGEGFINITPKIDNWIKRKGFWKGLLTITSLHTSSSLTINENADPRVLEDLLNYINAIVPKNGFKSLNGGNELTKYKHQEEGDDDMPAHIKTALTSTCLNLTINERKIVLGTWQGIYLWEHRKRNQQRKINLHAIGDFCN